MREPVVRHVSKALMEARQTGRIADKGNQTLDRFT
jgi:hypothetical protein